MAGATDVDLAVDDFDIDDFDVVIQALDMDLLVADDDREFRGGAACYSAIFSDADIVSHCRHGFDSDSDGDGGGAAAAGGRLLARLCDDNNCGGDDGADEEEEAGSSSPADSGDTDDGSLAAQAPCDDDGDAGAMSAYVAELERFLLEDDDEKAEVDQGLLFAGDQLLAIATAEVVPGRAGRTDNDGEEEENGDVLAAREDEQSASRKRARNKIKGTAKLTPWGELETMMMMHLAQIQAPAAPRPLLLCCM